MAPTPASPIRQKNLTADERFTLAKSIVQLFWPERYTYLGLSFITAVLVIWVGYKSITQPGTQGAAAGVFFGSGGIVTFNIGRLSTMFNKVFDAVLKS